MSNRILKSQIRDEAEFRAAIEALIQAKIAHLDVIDGTMPSDHFLEQFIKRTPQGDPNPDKFEVDYELVDDTPPPPTAEELRIKALNELRAKEAAEIEAVFPTHKRRLAGLDYARIVRIAEADRTPEQAKAVADYSATMKAIEDIQYAYAKREAEL